MSLPDASTPLADLLIRRIAKTGPITLSDYMGECLMHPEYGYYATRDPFGQAGDFITAPEISQMFGEMLGLFMAQVWIDQGRPAPFTLAELGPGRGTLMADMLRATKGVPGFHSALELHLVEASPVLRNAQAERLAPLAVIHHDVVQTLPDQPLFLVANEFFDALPIRQFIREGDMWREHQVGETDGKLSMGLTAPLPQPLLDHRSDDTRDGDLVEVCPALGPITEEFATRINTHGGVALIIDYGDWRSLGDTFQALSAHKKTDPLASPGLADLTAHVDFERIAHFAAPLAHSLLTPQGVFLERLGITNRAQTLAKNMRGDTLDEHISAHRRLTHPDEMGTLFKVVGLTRPGASGLPGLEMARPDA
ncbi:SAM-dependent methyltransferase [Aliiroseovarius sp. KMU-50]|uniref:SAM-dependent methyltransferase n=1 Tax=Aliiroseovarius salicola TaxID=3009082 RepID=A0ABT4VZH3_9RHOB|nr:SAM-dependent methyltransferase [Aliiroseovarius sp. KMU-50]MDA5093653.1 SAM-dependent methyltransferase [Aliiroseovarius sp. KMU-50]